MKEYTYNKDIAQRVAKIMGLVYEVNTKTDYALFFSFSGHTNQIELHICTDKTNNFSDRIADSGTIYFRDDEVEETVIRLDVVIMNLEKLLPVKPTIEL